MVSQIHMTLRSHLSVGVLLRMVLLLCSSSRTALARSSSSIHLLFVSPAVNHHKGTIQRSLDRTTFDSLHSFQTSDSRAMTTFRRASSSSSISSGDRQVPVRQNGTPSSPQDETQVVQNMLYRIRNVNKIPDDIRASLIDFVVDEKRLGKVTPEMADKLCQMTGDGGKHVFGLTSVGEDANCLTLSDDIPANCEARTEAVMSIMKQLAKDGVVTGWRDELYPVTQGFYEPPTLLVERAAAPFLGCMEYGIHVNGIIGSNGADGEPKMWIARRSKTKSKYPGMLDHVVAGGQPSGLSLMENVVKECYEEAGIPEAVTRECVRAGGAISYETFSSRQGVIGRAVLFCYELHLPHDFEPKPVDGEVDEFFTWTMDQVKESMAPDFPDPIKPNCYPVIIDYLLRANHVSPETPGYLEILRELRGGDCR